MIALWVLLPFYVIACVFALVKALSFVLDFCEYTSDRWWGGLPLWIALCFGLVVPAICALSYGWFRLYFFILGLMVPA